MITLVRGGRMSGLLLVSDSEIKQLSDIVQKQITENIINKYNAVTKGVSFDRIPYNTRTAIIDIFYQYNINTASVKEPKTWGFIINNDWNGFYNEHYECWRLLCSSPEA
ncbi:hypothetical protein EIL26_25940 [Salmonella enterica subsp. enterica serovar Newport]|nr:hypothetical protein LFZ16_03380 [Salmonella enterica subsp. enterica serovar India str. SA20085604]EAS1838153.1 hypothetical protein [Salmonella enterica]EBR7996637.1 hypothetical protein [Salmonella enterica subsp. enterica serovar Panama]EBS4088644.1 hypothetical protein [Salmonella enterica subsp. enterica serovar Newport]EBV1274912.1 hypothetical protein [Salmonella enterica subsp. enterica serovar Oranienburg]ECA2558462.1 hypothetical protein [Salmonella enterica subsp. enterica serov